MSNEETEDYIIQNGDTLESISLQFDIPMLAIKQINPLMSMLPGEHINIPKRSVFSTRLNPIDSQIFNSNFPIDGALTLLDDNIRFDPYDHYKKPVMISLKGYVSSTIFPHPCELLDPDSNEILPGNSLSLLTVFYLNDYQQKDELKNIIFAGKVSEISEYQHLMSQKAKNAQINSNVEMANLLSLNKAAQQSQKSQPSTFSLSPPLITSKNRIAFESGKSSIITNSQDTIPLVDSLPCLYQTRKWTCRYRLSHDGTSFHAFSSVAKKIRGTVLLIKTNWDDIIGCFAPCGIDIGAFHSYSNGEAFIFTYTPSFTCFKWSRTKSFYINADVDCIQICDASNAAIWINSRTFLNGFSEKCSVFNSLQLTTKAEFRVVDMELWEIK